MKAEFEEKQYEIAACLELALGKVGPKIFSSGQVLEEILGYDVVAGLDEDHPIWRVLKAPRPKGVVLIPKFWKATPPNGKRLPETVVNLILQFKRPDYLVHGNARQWSLWNEKYYRFSRSTKQHGVLVDLEEELGAEASVMYACPAFAKYGDLEEAQLTGTILESSGYVSPKAMGRHKVWTYKSPGIEGLGNPSSAPIPFYRFEDLLRRAQNSPALASTSLAPENALPVLLERMAREIRRRRPNPRNSVDKWISQFDDWRLGISPEQVSRLRDYVSIQSTIHQINAGWWLLDPTSGP